MNEQRLVGKLLNNQQHFSSEKPGATSCLLLKCVLKFKGLLLLKYDSSDWLGFDWRPWSGGGGGACVGLPINVDTFGQPN